MTQLGGDNMGDNSYYIDRELIEYINLNFQGCCINFLVVKDIHTFLDKSLTLGCNYTVYDNLFMLRTGTRDILVVTDKKLKFKEKYPKYELGIRGLKTGLFGKSVFKSLNLESVDASELSDATALFEDCKIDKINIKNLKASKLKNMSEMFSHSTLGNIIGLDEIDTKSVEDMSRMFYKSNLDFDLTLNNFDTYNCVNFDQMFEGCKTRMIDVTSFYINQDSNYRRMFASCKAEVSKLKNFDEIITLWNSYDVRKL